MFSLSLHSSIPKLPLPWSRSLLIPSAHSYPSHNSIPLTYKPFRHFPKPPMFVFLYVLFYPLSVYSHIESSRYRLFRTQKKYINHVFSSNYFTEFYSYLSLPFACTTIGYGPRLSFIIYSIHSSRLIYSRLKRQNLLRNYSIDTKLCLQLWYHRSRITSYLACLFTTEEHCFYS